MDNIDKDRRYEIDWDKIKQEGPTEKDYEIILMETTKIIEDDNFPDKKEKAVAFYDRGIVYSKRGEIKKAIRDYSLSININATNEAYCNRGGIYYELGVYKKALEDFENALKLVPNDPDSNMYILRIKEKIGI
jgi:tetratricopeptide (TPR) repeat protein